MQICFLKKISQAFLKIWINPNAIRKNYNSTRNRQNPQKFKVNPKRNRPIAEKNPSFNPTRPELRVRLNSSDRTLCRILIQFKNFLSILWETYNILMFEIQSHFQLFENKCFIPSKRKFMFILTSKLFSIIETLQAYMFA